MSLASRAGGLPGGASPAPTSGNAGASPSPLSATANSTSNSQTQSPAPPPLALAAPTPSGAAGTGAGPPATDEDWLARSLLWSFPAAYSLQPTLATRASQLRSWSGLVQAWCARKRQWRLAVADAEAGPLFHNAALGKRLSHAEVMAVLDFMVSGGGSAGSAATVAAAAEVARAGGLPGLAGTVGGGVNETTTTTAAAAVTAGSSGGGGAWGDLVGLGGGGGGGGPAESVKDAPRAEWVTPDKSAAWIYWRRPEEWAETLAGWVESTGQRGVVLTLYELTEGEATTGQDFYGMPDELLRKVLQVLAKRGKAQVFGTSGEQGVKFF